MKEEQKVFELTFTENGNELNVHRKIVGFSKTQILGMLEMYKHLILNESIPVINTTND